MAVQVQPDSFNSSRPRLWAANIMLKMRTMKKRNLMLISQRSSWNSNSNNISSTRGQATKLSRGAKILTNSTTRMKRMEKMKAKRTMR